MPSIEFPQFRCRAGIARGEVTPPVGMYHRMWGAATQDVSTGIHRPLTATALLLAPHEIEGDSTENFAAFVAVDHVLLWMVESDQFLERVSEETGLPREQITVFFSHTHAAGLMGMERTALPGGEGIPEYLAQMAVTVSGLIQQARQSMSAAAIVFGTGSCDLAANRDLYDAERDGYVCGFNPDRPADDALLVARVTDASSSSTLGTIVNYACHPTTLAWDNSLISPDFVGAMRAVVEQETEAPCFFIQGASGDLGPREGFVGDTAVADRNGRQLGFAALSALEAIPKSGKRFEYSGAVLSGATIGTWHYADVSEERRRESARWQHEVVTVDLDYREDLTNLDALREQHQIWTEREAAATEADDAEAVREARAMIERQTRRLTRFEQLDPSVPFPMRVPIWRLGDSIWVAIDAEPYNLLQHELRAKFPDFTVIVGTLANGSAAWYLLDEDSYGKGLYQEEASILARGSLEKLIKQLADRIQRMIAS